MEFNLPSFAMRLRNLFADHRVPDFLLLLSVIGAVFLVLASAVQLVRVPYQIDYGEGLLVEGALRIRHTSPLYPNPFAFPVVIHVYGPVAYATLAAVLLGNGAVYPVGRMLVVGCSIIVCLLLSSVLRKMTGSRLLAVIFGFLLLTLPAFRFWLYLARADMIGLVFSLAGVALYVQGRRSLYWTVPLFALAIFCKYTLIAAPAAVFFHLLLNRLGKKAVRFGSALLLLCAVAFVSAERMTHGWFAYHMFSTHPDPYSLAQFIALGGLVFASAPVVTGLAAWQTARDLKNRNWRFTSIYFLVSLATALTAGKLGSATNHFLEWMIASCLSAGVAYSVIKATYANRTVTIVVLLSVSTLAGVIIQNMKTLQPSRELAECGPAYEYVRNARSGAVLAETLGSVLETEKSVAVSDPFEYFQLVKHGRWPDQTVEEMINQRHFGLVIADTNLLDGNPHASDVWPRSYIEALRQNYRTAAVFACRGARVMLEPTRTSPRE
jgi:hypothetical protein